VQGGGLRSQWPDWGATRTCRSGMLGGVLCGVGFGGLRSGVGVRTCG